MNQLSLIHELSLDSYLNRAFPYWLLKIPKEELVWSLSCDESLTDEESRVIRVYRKVKVLEAA